MKKKFLLAVLLIAVLAVAVSAVAACNSGGGSTTEKVEKVLTLPADEVHMSPAGEDSTYQIVPKLTPEDSSAEFLYLLANQADKTYLDVSDSGLLTALKAKGADSYIVVMVYLKSDRTVKAELHVYVEHIDATDIAFEQTSVIMELGAEPYQLVATLTPANASSNIYYKSNDESVCTVNEDGQITAKAVGKTTVTGTCRNSVDGLEIVATANVTVKYAELNYRAYVKDEYTLHQVVGSYEKIEIDLEAQSEYCDPNPSIKWYFDGFEKSDFADQKSFSITPDALTAGTTYQIYAELVDANGTTKKIEYHGNADDASTRIALEVVAYDALQSISLSIPTDKFNSYTQQDTAKITVKINGNEYRPELYKWYVKSANASAEKYIGTGVSTTYDYVIDVADDDVTIVCLPVVKGVDQVALKAEVNLGKVQEFVATGCEIYNAYIEGAEMSSGVFAPIVYWDAVARTDAEYRVQVNVGGQITTMTSTSAEYSSYFRPYGCFIPASLAGFNTTFSVAVGTNGYQYTDYITYTANTITASDEEYLEDIVPGMNGYISNMEEFGKLLNYINVFHPADLYKEAGNEVTGLAGYAFYAKFMFSYSELDSTQYPTMGSNPSETETPEMKNLYNIISAAFNCYCESCKFSFGRMINEQSGKIGISFTFEDFFTPIQITDSYRLTEVYSDQSYANPLDARTSDVLPIDSVTNTLSVTTSNQLYYALTLGYKPVPVANSDAAKVYPEMRAVLKRICSDTMTEAEKVHAIYDFLSTEVTYDYSTVGMTDSVTQSKSSAFFLEGVFIKDTNGARRAVCDGIAKAFNALCRMEGITAVKVSGQETKNNVGHAWNKVIVDGVWYGIDATWGSSSAGSTEYQSHSYLMVTDEVLNAQHITSGKYAVANTESTVYYNEEVITGADRVITSVAEAELLAADYIKPNLNLVNDRVILEIKLAGTTDMDDANDFMLAVKSKLTCNYTTSSINIRNNIYLIVITRK